MIIYSIKIILGMKILECMFIINWQIVLNDQFY